MPTNNWLRRGDRNSWGKLVSQQDICSEKIDCVHRHRFETLQHASRVIADWIGFYNHRRPHQALGMKTPAEAYALAA
jgi:transposase InsO family protein